MALPEVTAGRRSGSEHGIENAAICGALTPTAASGIAPTSASSAAIVATARRVQRRRTCRHACSRWNRRAAGTERRAVGSVVPPQPNRPWNASGPDHDQSQETTGPRIQLCASGVAQTNALPRGAHTHLCRLPA